MTDDYRPIKPNPSPDAEAEMLRQAVESMAKVLGDTFGPDEKGIAIGLHQEKGLALVCPEPDCQPVQHLLAELRSQDIEVIAIAPSEIPDHVAGHAQDMLSKQLREAMGIFILEAPEIEPLPFMEKEGGRRRRKKRSQWGRRFPWEQ